MASLKYKRKSNKLPTKRLKNLKEFSLSIGWFDAKYENGTPVAQVAMIQEFGLPEKNIPPRPFMRIAKLDHGNEWDRQMADDMKLVHKGRATQEGVLNELGKTIIRDIKQAIMNVVYPPLKEETLKNRRRKGNYSDKPLIDTKRMFDSLTFKVEEKK